MIHAGLLLIIPVGALPAAGVYVRKKWIAAHASTASSRCPHVGLANDPFSSSAAPSTDHRCYFGMHRDRIDFDHQLSFCLSAAHKRCPWLLVDESGANTARRLAHVARPAGRAAVNGLERLRDGEPWRRLPPLLGRAAREWLGRLAFAATVGSSAARLVTSRLLQASRESDLWILRPLRPSWPVATPAQPEQELSNVSAEPVETIDLRQERPAFDVLMHRGLRALERGQELVAYEAFQQASEHPDADMRAWFWRAKTAGDVREVVSSLEKALELDPGSAQLVAQLSWARARLERQTFLEEAARSEPLAEPEMTVVNFWAALLMFAARLAGGAIAALLGLCWIGAGFGRALAPVQHSGGSGGLVAQLSVLTSVVSPPDHLHLVAGRLGFDFGYSLPFVAGFLLVCLTSPLLAGELWARVASCMLAVVNAYLLVASSGFANHELGLALCFGLAAAAAGSHVGSLYLFRRVSGRPAITHTLEDGHAAA